MLRSDADDDEAGAPPPQALFGDAAQTDNSVDNSVDDLFQDLPGVPLNDTIIPWKQAFDFLQTLYLEVLDTRSRFWIQKKTTAEKNIVFKTVSEKIQEQNPTEEKLIIGWITIIYILGTALRKNDPTYQKAVSEPISAEMRAKIKKLQKMQQRESGLNKTRVWTPQFIQGLFAQLLKARDPVDYAEPFGMRTRAAARGPAQGRGFKGFKNMRQLISRTEDLISAAQMGNKSKEVFNELDSNLSVLIDKKKITKKYRENLMKNLFFQ